MQNAKAKSVWGRPLGAPRDGVHTPPAAIATTPPHFFPTPHPAPADHSRSSLDIAGPKSLAGDSKSVKAAAHAKQQQQQQLAAMQATFVQQRAAAGAFRASSVVSLLIEKGWYCVYLCVAIDWEAPLRLC